MIAVLLWHHHWGTSHAYYLCIGMFTLLKKISCSPSVSQSVSQLKPTICLCVFLQTFFFPLNTETAKIIWSQAWKERIGINYPSLHIFEEHSSKFKATRFKFCLPPSAKFEPPEILRWAVTFTSVGGLWKYSTAFLNQMDFFLPPFEVLNWRRSCLSSLAYSKHKVQETVLSFGAVESIPQGHIFL